MLFCFFSFQNLTGQAIDSTQHKIRTVVIDPGHGGKDSGAVGKNSYEKDIVLKISLKLGEYIKERLEGVNVIFTRDSDVFIPLHERARIANDAEADLFISVHANSNTNTTPYGTSSHILGLHRADENFEVAKRENSVILMEEDYTVHYENFDPNSPESYIIFSLMQDIYFDQSIVFAQNVQDQFRERAKRKDRGVKQQGLLVLAQTSMPGILIETGFISNETEEKYLNSEQGQDYLASAIFRAVRDYKEYIELRSGEDIFYVDKPVEDGSTETQALASDTAVVSDTIVATIEPVNKESITFKVQITASKNKLDLNDQIFKEFNNVEEYNSGKLYKYAVGEKTSYDEIVEYSKWVKNHFPDAFIIAIKNGEIISVNKALKEQAKKQTN